MSKFTAASRQIQEGCELPILGRNWFSDPEPAFLLGNRETCAWRHLGVGLLRTLPNLCFGVRQTVSNRQQLKTHDQLRSHLSDFVTAYNFARRLKTLKELTPYEFICKTWTHEPQRFIVDPIHQMPGLNITHVRHFKLRAR